MTDPLVVMVVSDDEGFIDDLRFSFPQHVEMITFHDAREAAASIDVLVPSVVIGQMRSGNSGGYSLGRLLAQRASLQNVPILLLTDRRQDGWLASQAGASKVLVQPLQPGQIAREALALAAELDPTP